MTSEIQDPLRSPGRLSPPVPPELARACLTILEELESSLEASQKALLDRDYQRIEQGTLEQTRLARAFAVLVSRDASQDAALTDRDPRNGVARNEEEAQLVSALRSAAMRVLHLARVQAALLRRAQRSARMLAHLAAGSLAAYGPNPER